MKKPSGFYNDSLEMLLDTMCNMLGAIVFIALLVALMAQDTPPPPPAFYQAQAAQLSNDLAAVTASTVEAEAELHATLLRARHFGYPQTSVAGHHSRWQPFPVECAFHRWTRGGVAQ
jgi:hypothetical protein